MERDSETEGERGREPAGQPAMCAHVQLEKAPLKLQQKQQGSASLPIRAAD